MAVKSNFSQLKAYQKRIEQLGTPVQNQLFYEKCLRELAARFLAKVIRRTPVGKGTFEVVKSKGKSKLRRVTAGGTLRRAWTAKTASQAESGNTPDAVTYANMVDVKKIGNNYHITITNPMQYASYVEKGHRQTPGRYVPALGKTLKKGWVNGKFMMKISDRELNTEAPNILRKKFNAYLKEALNAK